MRHPLRFRRSVRCFVPVGRFREERESVTSDATRGVLRLRLAARLAPRGLVPGLRVAALALQRVRRAEEREHSGDHCGDHGEPHEDDSGVGAARVGAVVLGRLAHRLGANVVEFHEHAEAQEREEDGGEGGDDNQELLRDLAAEVQDEHDGEDDGRQQGEDAAGLGALDGVERVLARDVFRLVFADAPVLEVLVVDVAPRLAVRALDTAAIARVRLTPQGVLRGDLDVAEGLRDVLDPRRGDEDDDADGREGEQANGDPVEELHGWQRRGCALHQ
mmetsp:Transcript_41041/g.126713  ORF Transcript_41041/g.126713 Transcript_41041/m.126713 type:complete len:275 (-) Transcript_41041:23-847(-)